MTQIIAPAFCLTADELILNPKRSKTRKRAPKPRAVWQGPIGYFNPRWDAWYKSIGGEWKRVTKRSRKVKA